MNLIFPSDVVRVIQFALNCRDICLFFFFFFQDLFFKYTWNNFLHLQVELCVAAILRPCVHEMGFQSAVASQEDIPPSQDTSPAQLSQKPASESSIVSENSEYNLMVTYVSLFVTKKMTRVCEISRVSL